MMRSKIETPKHWQRLFPISQIDLKLLESEINNLYRNSIHCPDTDESYRLIKTKLNEIAAGKGWQ